MYELWIVGKFKGSESNGIIWEFQGVFDDKKKAVETCIKDSYFVAPAILNESIIDEKETWSGVWYPRLEDEPGVSKNYGLNNPIDWQSDDQEQRFFKPK